MKKKAIGYVVLIISILGISTTLYFIDPFWNPINPTPENTINGKTVNSFGYILQFERYGPRTQAINVIKNYHADLLIMEPTFSQNPVSWWLSEEIDQMKNGLDPLNPKILLAYVSIGEAESYREYWNDAWDSNEDGIPDAGAPSWLDRENPDWEGNYKVKYWDPEWQSIIFGEPNSMIDKIMAQGFDGVYMDIIDAFEYYQEQGISDADIRMVDFVKSISVYTKGINPTFLIVPQNGESLAVFQDYIDAVDGIGREDLLYNGNQKQSSEDTETALENLDLFNSNSKFVLVTEYSTVPKFRHQSIDLCYKHGFLIYFGPRMLDLL